MKLWKTSTAWLLEKAKSDQDAVLAGATPYLKQFGNVAGGHYLGERRALNAAKSSEDQALRLIQRAQLVQFYAENYLTEAVGLADSVIAGASPLKRLDPALLSV